MTDLIKNAPALYLPTDAEHIKKLVPGTFVRLYGTIYTARDQAHKRIALDLQAGLTPPVELKNMAIYYCGPTPANGGIIGSCGPTTSGRMDSYAPLLIEHGVNVMIGKGARSKEVERAIRDNSAVYFTAIGGAAALYRSKIKSCELIAYPDLGCESVYKLEIEDFPVLVAIV